MEIYQADEDCQTSLRLGHFKAVLLAVQCLLSVLVRSHTRALPTMESRRRIPAGPLTIQSSSETTHTVSCVLGLGKSSGPPSGPMATVHIWRPGSGCGPRSVSPHVDGSGPNAILPRRHRGAGPCLGKLAHCFLVSGRIIGPLFFFWPSLDLQGILGFSGCTSLRHVTRQTAHEVEPAVDH